MHNVDLNSLALVLDGIRFFRRSPLTIVMDAGIVSEDYIPWLRQQGYLYIIVELNRLAVALKSL